MAMMLCGQLSAIGLVAAMLGGGGAGDGGSGVMPVGSVPDAATDSDHLELVVSSVELESLFGQRTPEFTTLYPVLSFALHNRGAKDVAIGDFEAGLLGYQLRFHWTCGKRRIETNVRDEASIRFINRGDLLIPADGCADFSTFLRMPLRIHHEPGGIKAAMRECFVTIEFGDDVSACDKLRVIWPVETEVEAGEVEPGNDEASIRAIVAEMVSGWDSERNPAARVPVVGESTHLPVRLDLTP